MVTLERRTPTLTAGRICHVFSFSLICLCLFSNVYRYATSGWPRHYISYLKDKGAERERLRFCCCCCVACLNYPDYLIYSDKTIIPKCAKLKSSTVTERTRTIPCGWWQVRKPESLLHRGRAVIQRLKLEGASGQKETEIYPWAGQESRRAI